MTPTLPPKAIPKPNGETVRKPIEQVVKGQRYSMETPEGEYLDYDYLLRTLGYEVVEWHTCGSYQGDHVALLRHPDGAWGFTVIGYGSCPGCDALEACDSPAEVDALRDELDRDITWSAEPATLARYIMEKDPANNWWMHDKEVTEARDGIVRKLLGDDNA